MGAREAGRTHSQEKKALLEKVREWLPRKDEPTERVGFLTTPGYIGVVLLDADGSAIRAQRWLESSDPAERRDFLTRFVEDQECTGASAFAVLAGGQYQVQQLEIPDIPDAELAGVARFRVRDIAKVSVETSAVSARRLERERESSSSDMVFVAIAEQSLVDATVALLEEAGLRPQRVVTRETAMAHLASVTPEADNGLAMLLVEHQGGVVTLGREHHLYLPRAHNYGVDQIQSQGALGSEGLALELQRSLDFYESQIATQPAARVYLLPTHMDSADLADRLRQSIVAPLSVLDLNELVPYVGEGEFPLQDQAMVALAVGAALPADDPPGATFYTPPVYRFEWLSAAGFAVVVGSTALLLAIASATQYGFVLDREAELEQLEHAHAELDSEVGRMEEALAKAEVAPELLARQEQLEATLAGQRRLEENLVDLSPQKLEGFSPFLLALSRRTVDGLWLNTLYHEPGATLYLEGRAWQPRLVPDFLDRLASEPYFQGKRFDGFEITRGEGHQQVQFRLSTASLNDAGAGDDGSRSRLRDGLLNEIAGNE